MADSTKWQRSWARENRQERREAYRRAAALSIGQQGLRSGCIVRFQKYSSSEGTWVVRWVSMNSLQAVLHPLTGDRRASQSASIVWRPENGPEYRPVLEVLYTPPQGFTHPLAILCFKEGSENRRDWERERQLRARLEQELSPGHRFQALLPEYRLKCEFWKQSAVDALIERFRQEDAAQEEARARARQARKEKRAQPTPQEPIEHFCATCGKKFLDTDPYHHRRRCGDCIALDIRPARTRYCLNCGSEFDSGAKPPGPWRCTKCR